MLPPELEEELQAHVHRSPAGDEILCAFCKAPVTGAVHRMSHAGAQRHTFENPGGFQFTLGLFREARCSVTGPASADFTWFAGYRWQIALCAGCAQQLGWSFTGGEGSFYGLILDRLIFAEG